MRDGVLQRNHNQHPHISFISPAICNINRHTCDASICIVSEFGRTVTLTISKLRRPYWLNGLVKFIINYSAACVYGSWIRRCLHTVFFSFFLAVAVVAVVVYRPLRDSFHLDIQTNRSALCWFQFSANVCRRTERRERERTFTLIFVFCFSVFGFVIHKISTSQLRS